MITGNVEKIEMEPFQTKKGVAMFRVSLLVNSVWYKTISKFPEIKIKEGDTVFFEVSADYPNSIELGTLQKSNYSVAKKAPSSFMVTKQMWDELVKRVDELDVKEKFNDDIPF